MSDDLVMVKRWTSMNRVHRRIEARIERDLRRLVGLGSREFSALSALRPGTWAGEGSLYLGDLATVVGLSQSATSRLVARLQDRGLITIRTSSDDRRSIEIELTAVAHDTLRIGTPVLHQAVTGAVGQMGAEDTDAELLRYLRGEPSETGTSEERCV
ncbi:MarR family winged helix-turn-helix transcriptional regulator [Streptomyces sp. NPDC007157]|uniref:MarR family winged helix-turn-helix transcriptional regulator n=1 Tax=Streptomyces sp. NPDC007157 TaxID=3154681 RepID=UPI0033F050B2